MFDEGPRRELREGRDDAELKGAAVAVGDAKGKRGLGVFAGEEKALALLDGEDGVEAGDAAKGDLSLYLGELDRLEHAAKRV